MPAGNEDARSAGKHCTARAVRGEGSSDPRSPLPAGKLLLPYGSSRMTRPVCVSGVQVALAVMKLYGPFGTIES